MSTNQQIIDRAAFELGYTASGDAVNAADSADALTDLNNMMAEWRESDRDLNWFPQDDLTEVCPIPDWAERGVISNLAVSLGAVFAVVPPSQAYIKAQSSLNAITRTLFNLNLEQADMRHLPQGRDSGRNILTDS